MFIDSMHKTARMTGLFSEMQGFIRYVKKFDAGEFVGAGSNWGGIPLHNPFHLVLMS